jgi:hypothetical protein
MTDKEIIKVVQAHMEGKKIQKYHIRWPFDNEWHEERFPTWDFNRDFYRVAPSRKTRVPIECEIYFRNGQGEIRNLVGIQPMNGTSILVREVIE